MCYVLELITQKQIAPDQLKIIRQEHQIEFYPKTKEMNPATKGAFYYSVFYGGCSCQFYDTWDKNTIYLKELLKEHVQAGPVTLFFIWQDAYYDTVCNNLHAYLDDPHVKKVNMPITAFLNIFMTADFDGEKIVYLLYDDQPD